MSLAPDPDTDTAADTAADTDTAPDAWPVVDAGGPVTLRRLWGMGEARWKQIRIALIAAYIVAYVMWFVERGIIIDRISVLLSVVLFLTVATIGRPWQDWLRLARDAALYVTMWIAYDESRGIADRIGMPIQVESVRDVDRAMFFGTDPVVWLQHRFYEGADSVRWYDVVGSIVYYSHFIVPPVAIATLYVVSRHQWGRYMRRFATVLFISCTMFVLVPTAPPWMAAGGRNSVGLNLDVLPELSRPTGNGWRHIGLGAFVKAWDTGRDWANQVAAMPSLHSAFAFFVVVFCFRWVRDWRLRSLMLLYPLTMAFALMYFAEHYFADALAGWAVVGVSFLVWNRIERRWYPDDNTALDNTALDNTALDNAAPQEPACAATPLEPALAVVRADDRRPSRHVASQEAGVFPAVDV